MEYTVRIQTTVYYDVIVEAEDIDHAKEVALEAMEKGEGYESDSTEYEVYSVSDKNHEVVWLEGDPDAP